MPPKIRQLIQQLKRAGFKNVGGKGSHRNFQHPSGSKLTISGNPGDDAKRYQIEQTRETIEASKNEKK